MAGHSATKFLHGFSAKLATRSRHICTFFGAGTSKACGLPDIAMLQENVLGQLNKSQKRDLSRLLAGRNLEQALSRLRRITALLDADQNFDGFTAEASRQLDIDICRAIIQEVALEKAGQLPTEQFAAWLARANYHFPVEVFTVNYDLLIETALEKFQVPYFDGFVGNLKARFQTELVESFSAGPDQFAIPAFFVRLWKLHGSVNWQWEKPGQIVRLGHAVTGGLAAAIYPSDAKYEESRRVPFLVLQDRMRKAFNQSETLVLVSGYSFGDSHLNEILFEAATRNQRTEIIVFCYSKIPNELAERAIRTPNIQVLGNVEAIIGGIRDYWIKDEDERPNVFEAGKFLLGNFEMLAKYLAKCVSRSDESDFRLEVLLANALSGATNPTEKKVD